MLQGTYNCQNMLKKKVFNKICSGSNFCQTVTKMLLKLKNKADSILLPLIIFLSLVLFLSRIHHFFLLAFFTDGRFTRFN